MYTAGCGKLTQHMVCKYWLASCSAPQVAARVLKLSGKQGKAAAEAETNLRDLSNDGDNAYITVVDATVADFGADDVSLAETNSNGEEDVFGFNEEPT